MSLGIVVEYTSMGPYLGSSSNNGAQDVDSSQKGVGSIAVGGVGLQYYSFSRERRR